MASKDKKNSHSSCIVLPFTQLSFMALLWLFQICIYYRTNKPDFASVLEAQRQKPHISEFYSGGRAIKPGWFQAIFQHFLDHSRSHNSLWNQDNQTSTAQSLLNLQHMLTSIQCPTTTQSLHVLVGHPTQLIYISDIYLLYMINTEIQIWMTKMI